nr:hypothetical protein [uncultured Desulfuromonas sp.]
MAKKPERIRMRKTSRWYKRIYVHIKNPASGVEGLRNVPLVLLSDGRPGYILNQYIFYLLQGGITDSKLEFNVRALEYLYAFTMALGEKAATTIEQGGALLAGFIDARRHGTDNFCATNKTHLQYLKKLGLHWEKTSDTSIKRDIRAINDFDLWQATFHKATRINPFEKKFLTAWEIYKDFLNRTDWDPLLHLHPTRTHERKEHQVQVNPPLQHKRLNAPTRTYKKSFPMRHILKLLDCASNSRDELLLLTMLGGSLRKGEPLHLYRSDIEGVNDFGELKVRLADPRTGMVEWTDSGGKIRKAARQEYLQQEWKNDDLSSGHLLYHLQSRDTYGKHPLMVGFKGMTFSDSDGGDMLGLDPYCRAYDKNYMFWLDPRIGNRATEIYKKYREQYLTRDAHGKRTPSGWLRHPWLFINISREGYGNPLSYNALQKIWEKLLVKLNRRYGINLIGKGLGWHSLRHFYGWYCASCLQIDISLTKAMMHHSSEEATSYYYKMSEDVARNKINEAALKRLGIEKEDIDLIIAPRTFEIDWPQDWVSRQLKIKMLALKNNMLQ